MKTEKESTAKTDTAEQAQKQASAAAPSAAAAAAVEEKPAGVRQRQTATSRKCPECGKDSKVTSSPKVHPQFIEASFRYYKCVSCKHTFKEKK